MPKRSAIVCRGVFFVFLASANGVVASQQVRCTCPSVKAEGRGQSDCSACEVGDRCTIDFNDFGVDLERAALARLKEAGVVISGFRFVDGPAYTALEAFGKDPKALADQILVYLAVSAATRPDVTPTELRELANIVRTDAVQGALVEAFGPSALSTGIKSLSVPRPPLPPGASRTQVRVVRDLVRISAGCVEVQLPTKQWFMYKTVWAEASNERRCGELQ